jgi:uncharacterized protein YndB with AHSA1/START domain
VDLTPHRVERWVACAPAEAFGRWVAMGAWWPPACSADPETLTDVRIGPAVGDPWLLVHGDRSDVVGEVTAWEPGHLLVHTSTLGQPDPPPSVIEVRFTPSGGATRVELAHGGGTEANAASRDRYRDWPLIVDAYVAVAGTVPEC